MRVATYGERGEGIRIGVDATDLRDLARDLGLAPEQLDRAVAAGLLDFGEAFHDEAARNLEGRVLNVRTRRLRGALAKRSRPKEYLLENDVVYGAYHEWGYHDRGGGFHQHRWFWKAFDDLGGEAGLLEVMEQAVDHWAAVYA